MVVVVGGAAVAGGSAVAEGAGSWEGGSGEVGGAEEGLLRGAAGGGVTTVEAVVGIVMPIVAATLKQEGIREKGLGFGPLSIRRQHQRGGGAESKRRQLVVREGKGDKTSRRGGIPRTCCQSSRLSGGVAVEGAEEAGGVGGVEAEGSARAAFVHRACCRHCRKGRGTKVVWIVFVLCVAVAHTGEVVGLRNDRACQLSPGRLLWVSGQPPALFVSLVFVLRDEGTSSGSAFPNVFHLALLGLPLDLSPVVCPSYCQA